MNRNDLKFGQPAGAMFQVAYTVDDIAKAATLFTDHLGVGPWYRYDYQSGPDALYRGKSTDLRLTILRGFVGHLNVELVMQKDESIPSVFRDLSADRGHGFHHWNISSIDFDTDTKFYQSLGYELAYFDRIGDRRIAFFDTSRDMPGMMEICEMTAAEEDFLDRMRLASLDFDGTDLIRDQDQFKRSFAVK